MKANPPDREQALELMSKNPNLIRRPLTVQGEIVVAGFARDELAALCEG